jgi:hypothetical protein
MSDFNKDFEKNIKLFQNTSFEKVFIKSFIRNSIPDFNGKNLRICYEALSDNSHNTMKIFTLLKPVFINYEYLKINKIVDLLSYFCNHTSKQLEMFQNNEYSIQV